jgi:ATPase subunit of ABC transporter with duplicated ATPase domains
MTSRLGSRALQMQHAAHLVAAVIRSVQACGERLGAACRLVKEYSGGWQMRICLGKILLQDPDVLLLDEPTNHLDIDAIEWLEGYVKGLAIPTVIVSHDRAFLDQVRSCIAASARRTPLTVSNALTTSLPHLLIVAAEYMEHHLRSMVELCLRRVLAAFDANPMRVLERSRHARACIRDWCKRWLPQTCLTTGLHQDRGD